MPLAASDHDGRATYKKSLAEGTRAGGRFPPNRLQGTSGKE
jgi:hypothetical protein